MQPNPAKADVERIASYLPSRLIDRLPLVEEANGGVTHLDIAAAVLVTDISGFTTLTERLVDQAVSSSSPVVLIRKLDWWFCLFAARGAVAGKPRVRPVVTSQETLDDL